MNILTKLTTRRWLITHVVVLAGIFVLINLGLWQLRRLEERRAYNAEVTSGLSQPPLVLGGEAVDPEELHLRRVVVTGTFDNEAGVILRNRPLDGLPGHHLVVPLRIAGSNSAVLVDRGWLPLDETGPEQRRQYDLTGEVTVPGVAYRSQTRTSSLGPVDPPLKPGQSRLDAWFRIDINRIQEQLPYPLLPIFIRQSLDPAGATSLPRPEREPVLTEGSHLGYALQWFTFAVILVITYGGFIRQELKAEERTGPKEADA